MLLQTRMHEDKDSKGKPAKKKAIGRFQGFDPPLCVGSPIPFLLVIPKALHTASVRKSQPPHDEGPSLRKGATSSFGTHITLSPTNVAPRSIQEEHDLPGTIPQVLC